MCTWYRKWGAEWWTKCTPGHEDLEYLAGPGPTYRHAMPLTASGKVYLFDGLGRQPNLTTDLQVFFGPALEIPAHHTLVHYRASRICYITLSLGIVYLSSLASYLDHLGFRDNGRILLPLLTALELTRCALARRTDRYLGGASSNTLPFCLAETPPPLVPCSSEVFTDLIPRESCRQQRLI